jgi:hypothetical protein
MEGMDWIDLAQDRGSWCAFVNSVMKMRGIAWLDDDLLASEEGLCSLEQISIQGCVILS